MRTQRHRRKYYSSLVSSTGVLRVSWCWWLNIHCKYPAVIGSLVAAGWWWWAMCSDSNSRERERDLLLRWVKRKSLSLSCTNAHLLLLLLAWLGCVISQFLLLLLACVVVVVAVVAAVWKWALFPVVWTRQITQNLTRLLLLVVRRIKQVNSSATQSVFTMHNTITCIVDYVTCRDSCCCCCCLDCCSHPSSSSSSFKFPSTTGCCCYLMPWEREGAKKNNIDKMELLEQVKKTHDRGTHSTWPPFSLFL